MNRPLFQVLPTNNRAKFDMGGKPIFELGVDLTKMTIFLNFGPFSWQQCPSLRMRTV